MRLIIAAVGRLRGGPEAELCADYAGRVLTAGRAVALGPLDIQEYEPPAGKRGGGDREVGFFLRAAPAGAIKVLLDERGEAWPSALLAQKLGAWRDAGAPAAVFWIGGADGTDPALAAATDMTLALGPQTWPHRLVRAMLAEQLYRAVTILAGGPYHRA